MIYIQLTQENLTKDLGLVEDEGQMKDLLEALEKICSLKGSEDSFWLEKKDLPDYGEIEINGHLIPISTFEFPLEEPIYLDFKEVFDLSKPGSGYDDYFSVIENYAIPYDEVKDYIETKEAVVKRLKKALEARGFKVSRCFQGSEDGDALMIDKEGWDQKYFSALDPGFIDSVPENDQDLESFIDSYLNE